MSEQDEVSARLCSSHEREECSFAREQGAGNPHARLARLVANPGYVDNQNSTLDLFELKVFCNNLE
jgi:hypothetical protein